MASTNKTTHYELSQYIGSDKPTYLVDYNMDMYNIDNGIYNAQSKADVNEGSIGTLSSLTTTEKSNLVGAINEIDAQVGTNTSNIATNTLDISANSTAIGDLTTLTTTAKTDLVSAVNEVQSETDTNTSNIGLLSSLTTTDKSSVVSAINEVDGVASTNSTNIGNLSSLTTTDKTSIVNAINELNSPAITLFESVSGETGNITLSDDAGDYSKIEVIFTDNDGYCPSSQTFYNPDGKRILISEIHENYYKYKEINVSSTSLNIVAGGQVRVAPSIQQSTGNTYIVIKKILGYK